MPRALLLLVALAAVLATAIVKVNKDTHRFVDAFGRERVFHGVNAVYKVDPWLPLDGPFDFHLSLNDKDMDDLAAWGFNVVRLGVMWPGAEPVRGQWNMEYLQRARELVEGLGKRGIYTIADAHQDLFGRALCGEGAPEWAVIVQNGTLPFPRPILNHTFPVDDDGFPLLEECLKMNFGTYYPTPAVGSAFQSLYDNVDGIQDDFAQFWALVAKVLSDQEYLFGYELLNEPWTGDIWRKPWLLLPSEAGKHNLLPMYKKLHTAIREFDDEHSIFFEKATTNPLLSTGLEGGPGGEEYYDRQVYSYHDYCFNVDRSGNPSNLFVCEATEMIQWMQEMQDIKKIGGGAMLTEFGAFAPNSTKAMEDLVFMCDLADQYLQSWAYWQFKYYNDFTTASNDGESFYNKDGTLQTEKLRILIRIYAQAIAGSTVSTKYDVDKGTFEMKYKINTAISAPTEIVVPKYLWKDRPYSVSLSPDGVAQWSASEDGGRVMVTPLSGAADGTTLTVFIQL